MLSTENCDVCEQFAHCGTRIKSIQIITSFLDLQLKMQTVAAFSGREKPKGSCWWRSSSWLQLESGPVRLAVHAKAGGAADNQLSSLCLRAAQIMTPREMEIRPRVLRGGTQTPAPKKPAQPEGGSRANNFSSSRLWPLLCLLVPALYSV